MPWCNQKYACNKIKYASNTFYQYNSKLQAQRRHMPVIPTSSGHTTMKTYFLFALAFGPQFAWGFSGNLASFINLDAGLASFRTAKDASNLTKQWTKGLTLGVNETVHTHFGSLLRMAAAGELGLGCFMELILTLKTWDVVTLGNL